MELPEYIVCVSDYDLSTEDGPEKFPDSPEVDPPPLPPLPPGRLHPGLSGELSPAFQAR